MTAACMRLLSEKGASTSACRPRTLQRYLVKPASKQLQSHPQRVRIPAAALWKEDERGHWSRSPEWYGTHAGGWGHGSGDVVFSKPSSYGNGQVEVTAHEASPLRGQHHSEEWRVLRFDGATRQSVARVRSAAPNVAGPRSSSVGAADLSDVNQRQQSAETVSPLSADPKCLAMEYTKTMAAAGETPCDWLTSLGGMRSGFSRKPKVACNNWGASSGKNSQLHRSSCSLRPDMTWEYPV